MMRAFCFCFLCVVSLRAQSEAIPPSIKSLEMGMPWKEFVQKSPGLVLINLGPDGPRDAKPDPEVPKGAVGKELPDGILIYGFSEGKLAGVILSRKGDSAQNKQFLAEAEGLFGPISSKSSDQTEPGAILYKWSATDRVIHVVIVDEGPKSVATLRIASLPYAERLKIER